MSPLASAVVCEISAGTSTSRPRRCATASNRRWGSRTCVLRREDAFHVDAHCLLEVVLDQAEHLVRLVDLHGRRSQAVVVAERRDATDVDAGHAGAAEIDRHAVRLLVTEGRRHALLASHKGRRRRSVTDGNLR